MAASWAGAAARVVECGGFWAGAAHPRRQKHREMPPPGASAPAFAATVNPARARPMQHPRQRRVLGCAMERVLGDVLKMGCFVHRFLIVGPNLRIAARFYPFMPSCVHRFLISGPDLRIDARFSPFMPSCVHRFLNSSPDLRIDARFSPETPSSVHRFLISGPDLGIDAGFSPETAQRLHRFLISGPDFRINARKPSRTAQRLHRFLISGPDLRIDAGVSQETPSSVHRFLISRPDLRIAAAPSLLQLRTARLQRRRGVQAGTGCHEGGIILSKKPPEWHLPLPQQRWV